MTGSPFSQVRVSSEVMDGKQFAPHPESAPGDFYVIHNQCLSCGVPHQVAPALIAQDSVDRHCIWRKQPTTRTELEQAIAVLENQDVGCHRYAGDDPSILQRLPAECCDRPHPSSSRPSREYRPAEIRLLQLPNSKVYDALQAALDWLKKIFIQRRHD